MLIVPIKYWKDPKTSKWHYMLGLCLALDLGL
jgi:hypothetical protein